MMSSTAQTPAEPLPAAPAPLRLASATPAVPIQAVPASRVPRANTPLMRKEHRDEIALFRYQVVRGAADASLSSRQRGPLVRALAAAEHPWPYGGMRRYSRETLDRWIKAWQKEGFEGLKPGERACGPVTDSRVLALAETLKRERPNRTAAQVKRIITETLGTAPSETTLLRHFRAKRISTGVLPTATGRFEADHSNEIWVGDALHGPRIGGRKTYLFAFLDDHSRMVTAARWAYAEDSVRLSAVLRPALQTHGIPSTVYLDNGSAFVDKALGRICARLGIRLTHSAPYRPQGRGKIERYFRTVTSQFLGEITITDTPMLPGTAPAGSPAAGSVSGSEVSSLEELNTLFTAWVNMIYHHTVHSTTGQTPLARWEASWEHRTPTRKPLEEIRQAFLWSETRQVTKAATLSLHANTYQVDPVLAGTRVEVVYDPFDLGADITVNSHLGIPAGIGTALEIRRHVHPKAVNATKDADQAAMHVTSGINYLDLVATRHTESLTGSPISFADIQDMQPSPDSGPAAVPWNMEPLWETGGGTTGTTAPADDPGTTATAGNTEAAR
ncbi:DDE-type integrase/transposase/recombinase [Arthrobacter sp. SDTb3-6]|uniref:DDE-type integrase/transposase/recombinase n=1 Tax=Arthrobacter sp. SDTb3-6 TaxID=2713571 RepID=UPI00159D11EF|nr:DDE-type integrase/transposase/recombinase [Arthrobacter sp. SDTb3-6]NVN00780.1 DDE-type integrase/transposase/recombinase [Arthrobacter sp. SDTb3-6]